MMNWDDLKVFLMVARTQKMVSAAKKLDIDASTASRRISRLEVELNANLFNRTVEGLILTEVGTELFVKVKKMELDVESALEDVKGINLGLGGKVSIGSTEAVGIYVLGPNMGDFIKSHPNIEIEIFPMSRSVRLAQNEADIAITIKKPEHSTMIAKKLCDIRYTACASKEYLSRSGAINSIDDLKNHQWTSYPSDWALSSQLSYLQEVFTAIKPKLTTTSVLLQTEAIKSGNFIGILPSYIIKKNAGLVPLFADEVELKRELWMEVHPERKRIARVDNMWGYLKELSAAIAPELV